MSTSELSSILLAAAPLSNLDREPFFVAVLEELAGEVVGPGSLSRACRLAQRMILRSRPPIIPDGCIRRANMAAFTATRSSGRADDVVRLLGVRPSAQRTRAYGCLLLDDRRGLHGLPIASASTDSRALVGLVTGLPLAMVRAPGILVEHGVKILTSQRPPSPSRHERRSRLN